MDLGLTRLRAHATAILVAASAALAGRPPARSAVITRR